MQTPPRPARAGSTTSWVADHHGQLTLIADELTGYHDPRLDLDTLVTLHETGMRHLGVLLGDLRTNYRGPDHHLAFFALRSVAVEAERAMRLRIQFDRLPEWTWRPLLRVRVEKIGGCLRELTQLTGVYATPAPTRPPTPRPPTPRPAQRPAQRPLAARSGSSTPRSRAMSRSRVALASRSSR